MRIRYKPWARKELEESKFYREYPQEIIGNWKKEYQNPNHPFFVELGCGKGSFIAQMACAHSENNYLAIDLVDPMLGLAKRKIEEVYEENHKEINNVLLTRFDIERILLILNEKDAVDGIYINFCNPWPRGKHKKRRLTHTRQLANYKTFLNKEKGEIYFKTDDDELFEESVEYFKEEGFEIVKITHDLHSEMIFEDIRTEHEQMFSEQGIKIKE